MSEPEGAERDLDPATASRHRFDGKRVVVIGGSSGIGRAVARAFLREGASVLLVSRSPDKLRRAADALGADTKSRPHISAVDVTAPDCTERLRAAVADHFDALDVLVNAAGIPMPVPIVDLTAEQWEQTIATNLTGTLYACQACYELLLGSNAPCVINVGSLASFTGIPGRVAYAASKGGVRALTTTLAVEWGPQGIRVNMVVPGFIQTPLLDSVAASGAVDLDALRRRTPLGRLGQADDVAAATLFLASDDAAFINGHDLVVDGGWLAYGFV